MVPNPHDFMGFKTPNFFKIFVQLLGGEKFDGVVFGDEAEDSQIYITCLQHQILLLLLLVS